MKLVWWICSSYGPQGCMCKGPPNHTGRHGRDGTCSWTDGEQITRMEADALLIKRVGAVRAMEMFAEQAAAERALNALGPQIGMVIADGR